MLSTPHMLVGAAITQLPLDPYISIPLAVGSHFILDAVPHWDGSAPRPPFKTRQVLTAGVDYLIGLTLIYFLTLGNPQAPLLFVGAISATLPDIFQGILSIFNYLFKQNLLSGFTRFHVAIQGRLPLIMGLITSSLVSLLAFFFLRLAH
jgi:hypothetical protein